MRVLPVNDPPVLDVPGAVRDEGALVGDGLSDAVRAVRPLVVAEDTAVPIAVSVRDVDSSELSPLLAGGAASGLSTASAGPERVVLGPVTRDEFVSLLANPTDERAQ